MFQFIPSQKKFREKACKSKGHHPIHPNHPVSVPTVQMSRDMFEHELKDKFTTQPLQPLPPANNSEHTTSAIGKY